ncbi:MAG: PQQ-dependent sugar dehydrogenase [Kouleothrix sp.]|nr:PQQ-dependent sugar dehydrogenase [Kouleothrix sp.]
MHRTIARIAGVVALALLLAQVAAARPAAAVVPAGFTDALLAKVDVPTALAFVSPDRLLIASQSGQLYVYAGGALLSAPALDLSAKICSNSERGLLGVAVDPSFASNHYIYVYYTYNRANSCPTGQPANPSNPVNRVARFTLSNANVASGETVLVDNIPSPNGNHNAGDLHFGQDGFLYVSVGDGGADYAGDSGSGGNNDATRDQFILLGKILRITRDGGIPPDNPFQGSGTARCNLTGRTSEGNRCQETFAWGLRNPYRLAFRPGTSAFYINDVGQNAWEEIDQGQKGADYGWNCREGRHVNSTTGKCSPAPADMVDPIYDYQHGSCNSITGGAFVPPGVWPAAYDGAYLFADFVCGKIFRLTSSGATFGQADFVLGLNGPTTITFGPYGSSQALYYLAYGGGEVRRLAYTGSANRSPVAAASASPRYGAAPLQVSFDGSASSDLDGDQLSYDWDFGDGAAHASGAQATHSYAAGVYTATLRVSDGKGGLGTATVRIDSGNTPPAPTIDSPVEGATFRVGQQITLHGSAIDAQDGALPDARLTWRVLLHHSTHVHPYLLSTAGNNITITAPPPEDLPAAPISYLEIELTATDSTGLSSVITRELQPHLVNITFETVPTGLSLIVNGEATTAPQTLVSWEGYALYVSAPPQQDSSGQWLAIVSWSDGGPAPSRTIVTPAADSTYTATFGPASVWFVSLARR